MNCNKVESVSHRQIAVIVIAISVVRGGRTLGYITLKCAILRNILFCSFIRSIMSQSDISSSIVDTSKADVVGVVKIFLHSNNLFTIDNLKTFKVI